MAYTKSMKQWSLGRINILVAIFAVFIIGCLTGYCLRTTESQDYRDSAKYRREHKEKKAEFHEQFLDGVKTKELEKDLRYFTRQPHVVGSPRQLKLAKELKQRWNSYGFDKVEMPEYKVLTSFPPRNNPNTLTLFSGSKEIFKTSVKEKTAEPSEDDPDVVPPFLAFAPNGTVKTNQLVYVNYGRVEDFERLRKLAVDIKGKVAIIRYGKSFRGNKVKLAADYGATAALLYSDPADFAMEGSSAANTYPNTVWLPSTGVQRGSLHRSGNGDPQTPGLPSLDGMYRISLNETRLPTIPAHPMSYGDAIHFLRAMGGNEVPPDWKGALNITYRLGPNFAHKDVQIELVINNKLEVKSIYNVIGTIYGKEEPDRYVLMGNHRDSWVFGAADPSSGTSVTTEVARGLGELLERGWRPRRTIKICSWGGEEQGLLGSVEWVEQHAKILSGRGVVYLNFDVAVGGNYVIRTYASPLMKNDIWNHMKYVKDPNGYGKKDTMYDVMLERRLSSTDKGRPDIGTPKSGSDHAAFYQYVGVPYAEFSYFFGYKNKSLLYPVYHTQHDTLNWIQKFVDPEFKFHKAMTQLGGSLLLHYADTPLLTMSVSHYAKAINKSLTVLKVNKNLRGRRDISLSILEEAVGRFSVAAAMFDAARLKMSRMLDGDVKDDECKSGDDNDADKCNVCGSDFARLRRINDQIMEVERAFINPNGLPGRPFVRHVAFAPSQHNLYEGSSFPGITDVLFDAKQTGAWEEVKRQISIAAQAVLSAVDVLTPYD